MKGKYVTIAVLVGGGLAVALTTHARTETPPGEDLCKRVLEETEPCPGCAFSTCACLYEGGQCPGYNISCSYYPKTESWVPPLVPKLFEYQLVPCKIIQQCVYKNGGSSCHPVSNPCQLQGPITITIGKKPRQTNKEC